MKFVPVAQAISENTVEYLLKVEILSRTMGFADSKDFHEIFQVQTIPNL